MCDLVLKKMTQCGLSSKKIIKIAWCDLVLNVYVYLVLNVFDNVDLVFLELSHTWQKNLELSTHGHLELSHTWQKIF